MNIWEIKNKNKLVFAIDSQYKEVLIYICKTEVNSFPGVPLTYEDLYYEFLNEVYDLTRKFDPRKEVGFKTYISIKCKYFCKLTCRKYCSRNNAVLNSYVEWDDNNAVVHDVMIDENKFSIALLDDEEMEYFKYRFLKGMQKGDVCSKMGISRYKGEKILEGIMAKVKSNQKN